MSKPATKKCRKCGRTLTQVGLLVNVGSKENPIWECRPTCKAIHRFKPLNKR